VLALVDCSPGAGPEYGELVRAGLGAALEGLAPGSRFGLVGFSDRISLVDLHGGWRRGGGRGGEVLFRWW
jgi:hypothetical protein